MIRISRESDEVLYPDEDIVTVSGDDLEELKRLALQNPRQRVRLCAHLNPANLLHEMFIVHTNECYVRPHKHPGKAESMYVMEGEVDVVLFDDEGRVDRLIEMGSSESGKVHYYRLATPIYHTLLIRSRFLVFHEVTNGPFIRGATDFADWSPEEGDAEVTRFVQSLEAQVRQLKAGA